MEDVSIIIPSRSEQFLQKTIDDLLTKAERSVEIIVILDGYWPKVMPQIDPRVKVIHHGTVHDNYGMRDSINRGVAVSRGKYVMKIDEHCMVDQGYDRKLIEDCDDDWVVIPRRYRLDPDRWQIIEDGRPPIDYMYIAYPYERAFDKTCGLHGAEWRERYSQRQDVLIDDTMSWQGSAYFMSRKWWDYLGDLDSLAYGEFTQEAQEIGNKTWLGGGRLVVNKKTWYAHWHKGKRGKGYGFSRQQYKEHMAGTEKGRLHCIDYWLNNKWDKRVHDWEWLMEKFWPVPTWPDNWQEQIKLDAVKDYANSSNKIDWYANNNN